MSAGGRLVPDPARGALNAATRRGALARVAGEVVDVLVVGGGVVGAGTALDAASRGLSVAVVEAQDWGSGTSSRSSRLIHGGLRYLEMRDFSLVHEALRERALLLGRVAPHLVSPVPFLYPLTHRGWERPYVGAGLALYDVLARSARAGRRLPRHRHLGRAEALRIFPALDPRLLAGAVQYWDAAVDDARLTLAAVRTAASLGASAASRARVVGLIRHGDAVTGASVSDELSGARIDVRARHVIVAAGAWTDELLGPMGAGPRRAVRSSKGAHLVVPRDRIEGHAALIARTARSVLFVIPWDDHWLVGTTDTEWSHPPDAVVATRADVTYLLEELNRLVSRPLGRGDVVGVYAGVRPLAAQGPEETSALSREHRISQPAPGVTVVTGGKLTTYRVMARDAVDAAAPSLPRRAGASRTHDLPLLGAGSPTRLAQLRSRLPPGEAGDELLARLVARHGTETDEVLALIEADPVLASTLPGAPRHVAAEVVHAARSEGALHLEDVLRRRTRLGTALAPDRRTVEAVAALLASELGWGPAATAREIGDSLASSAAERAASDAPDDASGVAALRAVLGAHAEAARP